MAANSDFFKQSPKRSTINFQKLVEDPKSEHVNYNLDDRCNLVQYGLQYSDDPKNENDTLYSGPMVGCHLVIGLLNDKSFMAHNNDHPDYVQKKNETIEKIKENPSGHYYLFFTSASMSFFYASPEDYIKEMEESYGVTFNKTFYYDDRQNPRKAWVEAFYNHKADSLEVSGFCSTIDPNKAVRYNCPPVVLGSVTNSLKLTR